jgi:hypothetical protein
MKTRKHLALWRAALALVLTAAAVAFVGKTPALEAQGRPDLEALHQRLLPLFETNGVVFTDADETSGRLVVGVLNRGVEGQVRGRLRALEWTVRPVERRRDRADHRAGQACATIARTSSSGACRFGSHSISAAWASPPLTGMARLVSSPPRHCSDQQGSVDGPRITSRWTRSDNEPDSRTEIADPP